MHWTRKAREGGCQQFLCEEQCGEGAYEDLRGIAEEIEVRIFTYLSAKRGDVSGLIGSRVFTIQGGIWCSGHARRERVAASSFYMKSNAERVLVKTYEARPTFLR